MATSAAAIITQAFVKLAVYAVGDTVATADQTQGLVTLNEMIDEWASQLLFIQQYTALAVTISNAIGQYTIGPNGSPSLTAARPIAVEYGPAAASVTISATTTAVNVVSAIEWSAIENVTPGTGTPDTLFYDPAYPLGKVNLAPVPNASGTVTFNAVSVLSGFPSLSSTAILATGVQNALETNLALALTSTYPPTGQLPSALVAAAAEGKDFLRYRSLTSRAMMKRRMISTGRAPATAPPGEQ